MIRPILGVILLCLVYDAATGDESVGDSCYQDGVPGVCTPIRRCPAASAENRGKWWTFKRCGFVDFESVVCCVPTVTTTTTTTTTTTARPVVTTPPMRPTTTEYLPPVEVYMYVGQRVGVTGDGCAPLDPTLHTQPTGIKSWDKCLEYQKQLIYPCVDSITQIGGKRRADNCKHDADQLIVGGVNAKQDEFPHMVLLGYGQTNGTAQWKCGGTLISDRFILTAGHCTYAHKMYVNYAIVGSLNRTENVTYDKVYGIKRLHKHPEYEPLSKSNDIALLETVKPIKLDSTTVPACLDVFDGEHSKAVATGWGDTAWLGSEADTLQKVTLTKFTDDECRNHYPYSRHMKGVNYTTQVCYGDYTNKSDTCQGDSGGPLTIKNHRIHCMYTVVGITSFGNKCGRVGIPGYYTKLAPYVPWIESIVWP